MSKSDSIPDWIYILLTLLVVGARLIKSAFTREKTTHTQRPESTAQPVFQSDNSCDDCIVCNTTELSDKQSTKTIEMGSHESFIEDDAVNNRGEETEFDLRKAVVYKEILNRKYE